MRYSLLAILMTGAIVLGCSNSDGSTVETSYGASVSFDAEKTELPDIEDVRQYLLSRDDDVYLLTETSLPPFFYATWNASEDPCPEVLANLDARDYVREAGCQSEGTPVPTEPAAERVQQAGFLGPIRQAKTAGLTPYWLGEEFTAGDETFLINRQSGFHSAAQGGPSLFISYDARRGMGGGVTVSTLVEGAPLGEEILAQVDGEPSVPRDYLSIGNWNGDLYTVAGVVGPVIQLMAVIHQEGLTVIATASAAGNAIPGEDPNPLIDAEALKELLEQLRPYPE